MGLRFSFLLWIKFIIGVEMSKSWYVLNSYSGYENKAKEQLLERITLNGMEDFFGKIEVPSEEITEMKGGKEKTIQKKFFPGYILVEMEMNDDTWHLVKETPRVLGFIGGTKTNPRPISENEANRILNQIESGVETTSQQNIYEASYIFCCEVVSTPDSIWFKILFASFSEIGLGLVLVPPMKPKTLGVSLTRCHVSSFISISTKM